MLCVVMLSVVVLYLGYTYSYAECHFAQCRYAECSYAKSRSDLLFVTQLKKPRQVNTATLSVRTVSIMKFNNKV